jgi:hypothetical protein
MGKARRLSVCGRGRGYTRLDNGTSWPLPIAGTGQGDAPAHIMRYAPIERVADVRFHAASIMNAYEALIAMPLDRSREVLRALRMANATPVPFDIKEPSP